MRKDWLLITTVTVFVILLVGGLLLYVRELRRQARHDLYEQQLQATKQEITVTIPEGYRREQIAVLLEKKGVTKASDFLAVTTNDEGQLFPDTYRFFPLSPANEVRQKMIDNFKQKAPASVSTEQLIMASIIEREAKRDDERADISGVYWNRFNAGIALTADPTVQYGKDSNTLKERLAATTDPDKQDKILLNFKFWQPITLSDYTSVISLFNTYNNAGLPPASICNPGLKSIEAAMNPTDHNYYYFFHTADGQTIYSRTKAEHDQNKAKYL